jgi:hypothetical protein
MPGADKREIGKHVNTPRNTPKNRADPGYSPFTWSRQQTSTLTETTMRNDALDPVEITARKTHKSKDDRQYALEQGRKRSNAPVQPIPSGPCCLRCPHWLEEPAEGHGRCRVTFISLGSRAQDRTVLSYDEAKEQRLFGADMLITKPWFTCRQFGRSLQDAPTPIRPSLVALARGDERGSA